MIIVIVLIRRLNGEYFYGIRVGHLLANIIKDWLTLSPQCSILDLRSGYENDSASQSVFTNSKLTIETLEQGVKCVQS